MSLSWWAIGSIICSTILLFLFIVGSFFEMRRYLRKLKKDPKIIDSNPRG